MNPTLLVKFYLNSAAYSVKGTLSWGLLGPEIEGTTDPKFNSKDSPVNLIESELVLHNYYSLT